MFKDEVRKQLEETSNGEIRMKLSDEARRQFASVTTASNAAVQAGMAGTKVSYVTVSAAIEASKSESTQPNTASVFADRIRLMGASGKEMVIPCAVCKATNLVTADLVEAVVFKIYVTERLSHTERGIVPKTVIRTETPSLFHQPRQVDMSNITKSADCGDYQLSMTAFPEGICHADELNTALQACAQLKAVMVEEALDSLKGRSKMSLLTAYRNLNRGMADSIFDAEYAVNFGPKNDGDLEGTTRYNRLLSVYHAGMGSIGTAHLTSDTFDFGLSIRRMVIAKDVIWTNAQKMSRVRQQGNGSYYVSTNEDCGLGTIPTTPEIVKKYSTEIDSIVHHCSILIENEARAENGYKLLELPELPKLPDGPATTDYATLLGISKEKEAEILEELESELKSLAARVCEQQNLQDNTQTADAYTRFMQ